MEKMIDQPWLIDWFYREYADSQHYKKPLYDPFEVFKPTKTFLREVVRQLKQRAYEKLKSIRECEGLYEEQLKEEHKKLCTRIRIYENYVTYSGTGGKGGFGRKSITDLDIARAREMPITDYYNGKFRSDGKRLVGTCPFHSENHGSFVIYKDQNSWWCYGACGTGGDVIDFVMKQQNLKFLEAVKFLLKLKT
jgi:hypothetical protein